MSTRDSMRRELRELAQLAETKRKERTQDARSSGEWSYVDPVEAATTAAEPTALTTPLATELPARPSNTTVPPAVESAHPAGGLFAVEPELRPRRGRAVLMGGAVAVALVAVALTGRSVLHTAASTPETAAAAPSPPQAPAPAADPSPASPAAAPGATGNLGGSIGAANDSTPGSAAPAASSAGPTSAPAGRTAPSHATRHRGGAPAHAVTKSAAPPAAKEPAGPQSLDDLIRKSVHDGAK